MKHIVKWVWFAEKCGAGSSEMVRVLDKFGSIRDVYLADHDEYMNADVSEKLSRALSDKSLEKAYNIVRYCNSNSIGILTYQSEEYPKSLRSLKNPPAVLYFAGNLPDLNKTLCISVVGTRKMSEYGMKAAYKIAYEVAASGAVVVSGMALGIDSVAASAALAAGGRTVAVLGSGIDIVYPREHQKLYNAIKERGAIISEYPPSVPPLGRHFPVRNRIISGISQGTVVIDAGDKSGALITAKTGILQGKDIYAVPSNIDSENSSGTNSLIRDGAQAVLCGYDIIKNYAYLFYDTVDIQRLRNAEKRSEFNPSALTRFNVRARDASPVYKGSSALTENEKIEQMAKGEKPKTKEEKQKTAAPQRSVEAEAADEKKVADSPSGDESRAALESLSEKHRKIFDELPLDRAISVDYLTKTGFKLGEVISALTVLEIKGLISSLPGGLYTRK